jgi:outer membrane protein
MADAGSVTTGNLLDAESQLASEEYNQVNAESQFKSATLTLVQLLELDSIEGFAIEEPTTDPGSAEILSQTPESIYAAAIVHLPEINSADLKVLSAERGVWVARSGMSPNLNLFGSIGSGYSSTSRRPVNPISIGYQPTGAITQSGEQVLSPVTLYDYEKTPFNNQLNNNLTKSLGLSLSVPLFNGWTARTNIARAKINLMSAQVNADQSRKTVYKSVQQAYLDALAAQKKYAAAQRSTEAMLQSYNYADKRFNNGLSSELEFLTATNNLSKARAELVQAKYDFIFKIKILDFYSGNKLSL